MAVGGTLSGRGGGRGPRGAGALLRLFSGSPEERQIFGRRREAVQGSPDRSARFYPEMEGDPPLLSVEKFQHLYGGLEKGERRSGEEVRVAGRIRSIREGGSSLLFLDILHHFRPLQVFASKKNFVDHAAFHRLSQCQIGDIIGSLSFVFVLGLCPAPSLQSLLPFNRGSGRARKVPEGRIKHLPLPI